MYISFLGTLVIWLKIYVISLVDNLLSIVMIFFLSDSLNFCEMFLFDCVSEITIVSSPFGSILNGFKFPKLNLKYSS